MSDTHMPCFYRGGENGVEKAKAIRSLPPRTAVIISQKALHICLLFLKHCLMALFTRAVNFHKWAVTYIQGRSLAACFRSAPWLPSSSSLRFSAFHFLAHPRRVRPGTGFAVEHLHGKVTAKSRVGTNFCGRLRHYSDISYKNIAYNEHKWIGSEQISSLLKIWACKNQGCDSVIKCLFQTLAKSCH